MSDEERRPDITLEDVVAAVRRANRVSVATYNGLLTDLRFAAALPSDRGDPPKVFAAAAIREAFEEGLIEYTGFRYIRVTEKGEKIDMTKKKTWREKALKYLNLSPTPERVLLHEALAELEDRDEEIERLRSENGSLRDAMHLTLNASQVAALAKALRSELAGAREKRKVTRVTTESRHCDCYPKGCTCGSLDRNNR